MLKVCLVGVGGISSVHISSWESVPEAKLEAICDIRPEQMDRYPSLRHYTDYKEMLEAEKPDIVDICLPTFLHTECALTAIEMGIHVMCEKPVSLKKKDIDAIYAAAKRKNVKIMVGQVLRFWPEYVFLKEAYEKKTYGNILSGLMTRIGSIPRGRWEEWMQCEERSGLVLCDLHIHDVDFLVYAFGSPKGVFQRRSKQADQDYVQSTYDFDGFSVMAEAAWYKADYPFTSSFRFQFENAVVEYKGELVVYEHGKAPFYPGRANAETNHDMGELGLPQTNAYAEELSYLVNAVLNNTEIKTVKPEELKTVLDILNPQK